MANPDFVPDSSDVPESGETVPPSPLIGGDQNTPVVAAPERTPEEKAKAAKELQERLDKARNGFSIYLNTIRRMNFRHFITFMKKKLKFL